MQTFNFIFEDLVCSLNVCVFSFEDLVCSSFLLERLMIFLLLSAMTGGEWEMRGCCNSTLEL